MISCFCFRCFSFSTQGGQVTRRRRPSYCSWSSPPGARHGRHRIACQVRWAHARFHRFATGGWCDSRGDDPGAGEGVMENVLRLLGRQRLHTCSSGYGAGVLPSVSSMRLESKISCHGVTIAVGTTRPGFAWRACSVCNPSSCVALGGSFFDSVLHREPVRWWRWHCLHNGVGVPLAEPHPQA